VLRLPTDDDLVPLLAVAQSGYPSTRRDAVRCGLDVGRRAGIRSGIPRPSLGRPGSVVGRRVAAELDGRDGRSTDRRTERRGAGVRHASHGRYRVVARSRVPRAGALGKEMRSARSCLCLSTVLGARIAESAAFLDNAASNAVSRGLGYDRERTRIARRPKASRARPRSSGCSADGVAVASAPTRGDRRARRVPGDVRDLIARRVAVRTTPPAPPPPPPEPATTEAAAAPPARRCRRVPDRSERRHHAADIRHR
jgi:hypothetical protein